MTNNWTNGEGMRGYCACDEKEARLQFRKRYRREPEKVIKIGWFIYCGPVEGKHDNR